MERTKCTISNFGKERNGFHAPLPVGTVTREMSSRGKCSDTRDTLPVISLCEHVSCTDHL